MPSDEPLKTSTQIVTKPPPARRADACAVGHDCGQGYLWRPVLAPFTATAWTLTAPMLRFGRRSRLATWRQGFGCGGVILLTRQGQRTATFGGGSLFSCDDDRGSLALGVVLVLTDLRFDD
jgi:hypothetical protein